MDETTGGRGTAGTGYNCRAPLFPHRGQVSEVIIRIKDNHPTTDQITGDRRIVHRSNRQAPKHEVAVLRVVHARVGDDC